MDHLDMLLMNNGNVYLVVQMVQFYPTLVTKIKTKDFYNNIV